MPSFGAAIVTYNGAGRVATLLESLQSERGVLDQLVIAEDPCPYPQVHQRLVQLAIEYDAQLVTRSTWGCMQGNAQNAMAHMETDVVCLLSDDIILTRDCLTAHRLMWEKYSHFPIGCAQIPYWGSWDDLCKMGLIRDQSEFYPNWREFISHVPRVEHWDFDGKPRQYVNVHGSGFSLRRDVWRAVGGFSPQHWSYDEDIAARIWLKSPCIVVATPGPPFCHYGGASQCGNEHPETRFHTIGAWMEAWGKTKEEMHAMIRERMSERAYIDSYFRVNG